jgi:hypothetical protein
MNVIFLDIDGVMNSQDFYIRKHNTFKRKFEHRLRWIKNTPRWILTGSRSKTYSLANYVSPAYTKTFEYRYKRLIEDTDKIKWSWLSEFCNRTNTKICVSSCWKWHFDSNENLNNEGWDKAFDKLGFINDTFVGITGKRQTLRGDEIKNWINSIEVGNDVIDSVDKYAIIDDDSDMLPEQKDSFFLVDGYYGLSPNTMYRIDRHFNKNNN